MKSDDGDGDGKRRLSSRNPPIHLSFASCDVMSTLYGFSNREDSFNQISLWELDPVHKTLIPASPEDRNQQFEVPYHRISGPVDDDRERSEERSSISEAEYLEVEEGVGENKGLKLEDSKQKDLNLTLKSTRTNGNI
ncbi:hypothetical protein SADUNF_Sadunf02G0013100 [Salix dunnii]|uniref:Uncharacterized protein n=1 Tax=Salix dunnii TaxID=1413687 RepID=A0A835N5I2_9ROSI|nr:hypothetical protein SADUNF_Sadunf02G0013100 [Salix dunnii]